MKFIKDKKYLVKRDAFMYSVNENGQIKETKQIFAGLVLQWKKYSVVKSGGVFYQEHFLYNGEEICWVPPSRMPIDKFLELIEVE